jgi:malonate decarboxylase beta subunit
VEGGWGRAVSRGRTWFEALAGVTPDGEPASVLCADGTVGDGRARFLAVVPHPEARFPRARGGELGLEEGWALARRVREAVADDVDGDRRALVAVVDVPGQPYGYREELLGLHLALASAVDAYATARLAGHPVVALVVGQAISGAFLAHGMQANRILALADPGVAVQVMSKRSTARVTRRSVDELDEIAKEVPATAYDVTSFARLGALHRLIQGIDAAEPDAEHVETVRDALTEAITSARHDDSTDLSGRLVSPEARLHRGASLRVRERLAEVWSR